MEKVKKFLVNVVIVAYAIVAIAVTILLLSYNQYHCSVLGGYTFILVTDEDLEPNFNQGDLVLVKETKAKNIKPGDYIFLYRSITTSEFEIKHAQVLLKDESKGEYNVSYVLEGSTVIDHQDVIGSAENAIVVPHLGTVLSILESRYGYLFLIVVVSFIAFLYEIYELIMEIKYGDREDDEDLEEDDDDYDYEDDDDEEEDDYEDDDYDEEDNYDEEDDDDEYEEVVVRRRKKKVAESKPVAKKAPTTAKKSTSTKTSASTKKATTAKKASTATTKKPTATRATATKTTASKTGVAKKTTTKKNTAHEEK